MHDLAVVAWVPTLDIGSRIAISSTYIKNY